MQRRVLAISTDFGQNDDGPVYDRWDTCSQAPISRAEYPAAARPLMVASRVPPR